jgi:hypothetical protein
MVQKNQNMAIVLPNGQIQGKLGGCVYYMKEGVHCVMTKASMTKKQMKANPAFENTFLVNGEFGFASKYAAGIRHALGFQLVRSMNMKCHNAFSKKIHANILSSHEPYGSRRINYRVLNNDLKGHDFNIRARFQNFFHGSLDAKVDRKNGLIQFDIGAHNSRTDVHAPGGTTHYQFICGVAFSEENNPDMKGRYKESAYIPWTNTNLPASKIIVNGFLNDDHKAHFYACTLIFYQKMGNGTYEILGNCRNNATIIVGVDVL